MIQYVLMVSEYYPKTHIKSGQPTGFPLAIKHYDKIHTIRGNYDLWAKRFEKIDKGLACLSVRIWEGKPYMSKQLEIFRYDKTHNIGVEKLTFQEMIMTTQEVITTVSKYGLHIFRPSFSSIEIIAKNDGLSKEDFKEWFKNYDLKKEMVIIHFTDFRYLSPGLSKEDKFCSW